MPPNPPQRKAALSFENPSLSDEDVGLLYQIVIRAELDPDANRLPFRALFKAYDEVIAEHEVDADPGHACLRFLFKMGSKEVVGDSLFEKFENLLRQMGIVIEFGGDDTFTETNDTYEDKEPSIEGLRNRRVDRDTTSREDTTQTRRRRRASFNSMYDVGEDITQRSFANRPSSRSSMSRLQTGKTEFPEPTPERAEKQRTSPDRTQLMAQFVDVGRKLMRRMEELASKEERRDKTPAFVGKDARSAVDRDRSERMAEASRSKSRSRPARAASSIASDEDSEGSTTSSQEDAHNSFEKKEVPPEMLYRPSLSDLLRDASTFNMYRQRAIARRILTQWLKKAVQTQQTHRNMEVVAVNRDRITLLRQAFETWRTIIQDKRRVAQTEKFFKHLEERAGRARDLYLMTKAFTHWAQIASDEVAKTSAARRHILRVKYFNAWREITAVNELKAQRFALRRPFNAWRSKAREAKEMEQKAVAVHNQKLTHAVYWQWFWSFCDRRAPQWYDHRLKRRSLLYWLRKFRMNRERIQEIDAKNKHTATAIAWQLWHQRSKAIVAAEKDAICMDRKQVLQEKLGEWRVEARLGPIASRVSATIDRNITQTAFSQWAKRLRMLRDAKEVDRLRVTRNAWTAWNDLLRCQALTARIEERMKMEIMYKWILAERFRLMQRIRDQRITRDVFARFVTNVRDTYTRLLQHADVHEEYRNEELLRSKFICWREQLALQHQREVAAAEFYAPRLQQESLVAWHSKHQHLTKLEGWARDARYYFLATRTIKKWHKATLDSAKRRRQEAYAKMRRKIKINLALKALTHWHSRAQHVAELEQQAIALCRSKTLVIAAEYVETWRDSTDKRVQDCEEADILYARQIARGYLARWTESSAKYRDLKQQANDVHRLHGLGRANGQLRKLSLRVFQIKSSFETANSMHERNLRKHARSMFRHWLEKARMRLEARDIPGPLKTPARAFDGALTNGTDEAIFDPWYRNETPFKLSDFRTESQVPSATPLTTPNYMMSPSKRAARAKALTQISTTPATPLYTPFASRLLRAEGMGTRTGSSFRNRNGRGNGLGTSVRFVDQPPESPTDGRGSGNRRP
jgi:protein SFI1